MGHFSNQVALITGGSRGIGLITAQMFQEKGARLAICAQNPERLNEARRQLSRHGEVEAKALDIRDTERIEQFVGQVRNRFGRIDILVNNAGIARRSSEFIHQPASAIDDIVDINVKGLLHTTRVVLPIMIAQASGVIINVSSGAGLTGFAGLATYCASKFAVVGFTESLAQEVAKNGVRVHGICPGRVATDMQEVVFGERVGMPVEKVAEQIIRLAGARPPAAPGECLSIAF